VAGSLGFPTCSFGTDTHLGKPANPGMVTAAAALGYDLSGHRTAPLEGYAWRPGDLVLVFEPMHLRDLASGIGKDWRIELLGAWARPRCAYIHDPFEGTPQYYQRVAKLVEAAVTNLVASARARNA
jgi:protein-tyrosine phosphatase